MDKGSYTFQALSTKYEDFRGPAFTIKVDGTPLDSGEMPIASLEVELAADGSAGGCHFSVESLYDFAQSKWTNNLAKIIQVGAKLEILGGYVKQELIFYGYVDEFSMEYSGSAPPRLAVTGIDGFGYLMSCQEPIYGGKKKPQKVVEDILTKAISAGYAKKKTVGSLTGFDVPVVKERLDDFKYLRLLSQRYCMSLFCVAGELIFDNVVANSSPLITFTVGVGLLEFRRRLSLQGQVGQVEIWGRDEKQQFIKGAATRVSVGGRQERRRAGPQVQKNRPAGVQRICPHGKGMCGAGPGPLGQPGPELCLRVGHQRGHPRAHPRPVHHGQGAGWGHGGELFPVQGPPSVHQGRLLYPV